jgi:antitoxin VapB
MEQARLFTSGNSQAVRLPKNYRFKGDRVYIKRMGNAIVLLPRDDPWQPLREALDLFSADYMVERAQPTQQVREDPFE